MWPNSQIPQCTSPCPTMHPFVTEICTRVHTSVTKWCIVGYISDALWDLWDKLLVCTSIQYFHKSYFLNMMILTTKSIYLVVYSLHHNVLPTLQSIPLTTNELLYPITQDSSCHGQHTMPRNPWSFPMTSSAYLCFAWMCVCCSGGKCA